MGKKKRRVKKRRVPSKNMDRARHFNYAGTCRNCQKVHRVHRNAWRTSAPPRCDACGGMLDRSGMTSKKATKVTEDGVV